MRAIIPVELDKSGRVLMSSFPCVLDRYDLHGRDNQIRRWGIEERGRGRNQLRPKCGLRD